MYAAHLLRAQRVRGVAYPFTGPALAAETMPAETAAPVSL